MEKFIGLTGFPLYIFFIDGRSVHITFRYPVGSDDVNIETQWNLHLYVHVSCFGTSKKLENTTQHFFKKYVIVFKILKAFVYNFSFKYGNKLIFPNKLWKHFYAEL